METEALCSARRITLTRGRVAFTHELFARFLTAEQLVLDDDDTATLTEALREPRYADLKAHAVALEYDTTCRRDLLLALADTDLLRAAVHGKIGPDTAAAIRSEVDAVLPGRCLADGLFLEQTCALLDAADRRCADEMRALRDGGHRAAISAIVRSTYGGERPPAAPVEPRALRQR